MQLVSKTARATRASYNKYDGNNNGVALELVVGLLLRSFCTPPVDSV